MKSCLLFRLLFRLLVCLPFTAQSFCAEPNISGRVTDASGKAIQDAFVCLAPINAYGRDLVVTKSDEKGGFALASRQRVTSVRYAVVAWKPGYGVAYAVDRTSDIHSSEGEIPIALGLRLVLPQPVAPITFQVLDPQGNPVSSAAIELRSVTEPGNSDEGFWVRSSNGIPFLRQRTDPRGMVTFDFVPPTSEIGFSVKTEEFGAQHASIMSDQAPGPSSLRLLPTTRVQLQVLSDDGQPMPNRELNCWTRLDPKVQQSTNNALQVRHGFVEMKTNAEGRVEANVLSGQANFGIVSAPGDRQFANTSKLYGVPLKSNEPTSLTVNFKSGVPFSGRVVDGDGQPVAGVAIQVQDEIFTTDHDGRYKAWANPNGWVSIRTMAVPKGYAMPYQNGHSIRLPDPNAKLERDDIVIERAVAIRGRILNSEGRPVPRAIVKATWQKSAPRGSSYTIAAATAITDTNGRYELDHVLKDVDIMLFAATSELASPTATIYTDDEKEVELTVRRSGMVHILGTVKAANGSPIPGAEIQITQAMVVPGGHIYGNHPVRLRGRRTFVADTSGRFTSPAVLPRCGRYSIKVGADGFLSAETSYTDSKKGDLDFGEIRLTPSRLATGTIVDSQGRPIPGARISAFSAEKIGDHMIRKTEVKADATGRYTLEGLHPLAAVAIVEMDGYRTSGAFLIKGAKAKVTLYRADEVIPAKERISPRNFHHDHRNAAADRMLSKLLSRRRNSGYFRNEICQMLLRIGRDRIIGELNNLQSALIRTTLLKDLGELEEAVAESANISDPFQRCLARGNLAMVSDDPMVWTELLSTALTECGLIQRPDRRLFAVSSIAGKYREKGDSETAKKILKSQLEQARELSGKDWSGFARGKLAEESAHFEFDTAMELLKPLSEDDQSRHYQNIAHLLAQTEPARAEAVLRKMQPDNAVNRPAVRVAYRMAKTDLPRAMGLLETLDDRTQIIERARTYGVMAMAVSESGGSKAKALELLEKGLQTTPQVSIGSGDSRAVLGAAMTLLRYSESVAPESTTDFFWQAANRYAGPLGNAWSIDERAAADVDQQAKLAILLAMYETPDPIVDQVMEPVFAYWEAELDKTEVNSRFTDYKACFTAMALADPDRAGEWAVAFDKQLNEKLLRRIPQPWEVIGRTLTKDRKSVGKQITREIFRRWVIDEYDF